jgi:hypothetical protein
MFSIDFANLRFPAIPDVYPLSNSVKFLYFSLLSISIKALRALYISGLLILLIPSKI